MTGNLLIYICFCYFESTLLRGWRHLEVTDQRTAVDWAHQIRDLVDVHYPEAARITLVMDNLNTHKPASPKAFAPRRSPSYFGPPGDSLYPQARQLAQYGRDRAQCPEQAMSRSANTRSGHSQTRSAGLATTAQSRWLRYAVAFYD